jgi:hypothetical protein
MEAVFIEIAYLVSFQIESKELLGWLSEETRKNMEGQGVAI